MQGTTGFRAMFLPGTPVPLTLREGIVYIPERLKKVGRMGVFPREGILGYKESGELLGNEPFGPSPFLRFLCRPGPRSLGRPAQVVCLTCSPTKASLLWAS